MSPDLTLVAVVVVLVATGVYLLLERSLTRVLVGVVLLGNGLNVLFLVAAGPAGEPAFVGSAEPEEMTDPLPQALVLTAIVITLGLTAFLLALAYRSWQLHGHDEVQDDIEDRLIVTQARRDEMSRSYDPDERSVEDRSEDAQHPHRVLAPEDGPAQGATGDAPTGDAPNGDAPTRDAPTGDFPTGRRGGRGR